jgi:starvation-inducible DNA-binding protein
MTGARDEGGAVLLQPIPGGRIMTTTCEGALLAERAYPMAVDEAKELPPNGTMARLPVALDATVSRAGSENLNRLLAASMTVRDLYKKHRWPVSGPTFHQLHRLFDKHFNEQSELVDAIAERIRARGAVSKARFHVVAEPTPLPRPPRGRDGVPGEIPRLFHAHETVLQEARTMAGQSAQAGDDGRNDHLVSDVIRTNEKHVWSVAEHLVSAFRSS